MNTPEMEKLIYWYFKEIVLLILITPLLIAFLCAFIVTFLQFIQLIKGAMHNIKIIIRNMIKK